MTILVPVLLHLLTVDDQSEEVGGRGGAVWLVLRLSLLRSQLRSNAQIPISEQFNIPHRAVSRQIVSLPRAGMLVMITSSPLVFLSFICCRNIPLEPLGGAMSQLEMYPGSARLSRCAAGALVLIS